MPPKPKLPGVLKGMGITMKTAIERAASRSGGEDRASSRCNARIAFSSGDFGSGQTDSECEYRCTRQGTYRRLGSLQGEGR